jgi:protein TonB
VHTLFIVTVLLFIPSVKEKKTPRYLFARLVSPDEFLAKTPFIHSIPEVRSTPHVQPKAIAPAPSIKSTSRVPEKDVASYPLPSPSAGKEASQSQVPSPPASPIQGTEGGIKSKGTVEGPEKMGPSIREKLFDKGIIGDLAKREIEKEDKGKKDRNLTFDTKDYKFLLYNKRLKERIESIWLYPPDEATRGIYGDLIIKFIIKKNGRLGAVELIRTSGHKNLDDAAIKALRDGEPYWPLPDEWGMEAYTIEGHFVYTIYGYYIR